MRETALRNAFWKLLHYTLPSGAVIGDEGLHGLPLPEFGYEYCTLTELLYSLTSALQKTGNVDHGDWIESLAFNAGHGARLHDGSGLAYLSLDTRTSAKLDRPDSYSHLHGRHRRFKYSPTHEDVACCCNPNAVRFLPHYISRMWMQTPGGLAAALYGPCGLKTTLRDVEVTIAEETQYPFSDRLHFRVSPARRVDFELSLRKPAWSQAVRVDGADAQERDGWLVIQKKWFPGDRFTLSFDPRIETVPYPNGEFAVRRGPLQFVYPIEHRLQAIKEYPRPGFHDSEILPVDLEQAYQPILLDGSRLDQGLKQERDPARQANASWDQPPLWLDTGQHRRWPCSPRLSWSILRWAERPWTFLSAHLSLRRIPAPPSRSPR